MSPKFTKVRRSESRGSDDGQRTQDGWGLFAKINTASNQSTPLIEALLEEAGVTTVQFGLSHVKLSTPALRYKLNPVALVTFKLAGQSIERKISVVDGCCLSGVGDSFEVKFSDESSFLPGLDQEYWLTAIASPGTRAPTSTPPLYYPIITRGATSLAGMVALPPAGSQDIAVPRGIGVCSAMIQSWPAAAAIVPVTRSEHQALTYSNFNLHGGWDTYYDGSVWHLLPPAIDTLTLHNFSASPVCYRVAFGIDG